MYTIFYDEVSIHLTDNLKNESKSNFLFKDNITISEVLMRVQSGDCDMLYLYSANIKELWKQFKDFFKIEKAAGGLVKNLQNETLFIYRFNRWDLPKGKIEKGEGKRVAAIREVEEECGISNLSILKKLQTTYHIFQRNNRQILKITYWYEMTTDYDGQLTPQLEEDITEVVFKDSKATELALENTYGNIKLLFVV